MASVRCSFVTGSLGLAKICPKFWKSFWASLTLWLTLVSKLPWTPLDTLKSKKRARIKIAKERLREDASLGQRTSLPVEDIIHLLSFCLLTPTPNPANSFHLFTAKVSQQLFLYLTQNIGCAQVIHVSHACYGVPSLVKGNRSPLLPCSVIRFHSGPARWFRDVSTCNLVCVSAKVV